MIKCAHAGRATDPFLCRECAAHLVSELQRMPWLHEQVLITQHGGGKLGSPDGGGFRKAKKTIPLPPYRADADRLAYTARQAVYGWVTLVARSAHIDLMAGHRGPSCLACSHRSCVALRVIQTLSIADLSRFLAVHIHTLQHHPDAVGAYNEITGLATRMESKINRPAAMFFAGPCDDCGCDLYVRIGAQTAACQTPDCHRTYDVKERRDWLIACVADSIIDAPTIAKAVTQWTGHALVVQRIYEWRARGRLGSRGHGPAQTSYDSDGRLRTRSVELFRFGDVVSLVSEAAAKRRKQAA